MKYCEIRFYFRNYLIILSRAFHDYIFNAPICRDIKVLKEKIIYILSKLSCNKIIL